MDLIGNMINSFREWGGKKIAENLSDLKITVVYLNAEMRS